MSAYVVLTAFLFQKGSAESSDPDVPPRDADLAKQAAKPGAPKILRQGAFFRGLYAHSLGITLLMLFAASFFLHRKYSAAEAAAEPRMHGEIPLTMADRKSVVKGESVSVRVDLVVRRLIKTNKKKNN